MPRTRRSSPSALRPLQVGPAAQTLTCLRQALFVLTAGALGCLSGCATESKRPPAPVDVHTPFSDTGRAAVPDRWWTVFDDPALSGLVEHALASNLTLKTAWQRLREARAVVERESAALFPDLEGSVQARADSGEPRTLAADEALQLGVTAGYEVDLWGRIGSAVEAERYRARASLADYHTASLSVAAEVARTWYRLVEAREQLALINDQIDTNEQVLRLIEARFGTGQTRGADILRQRQLLEATRAQRHLTESRIRTLEHRLAVLLGRPPQAELDHDAGSLPALPGLPDTGLPVALVRRRPDVRGAFERLRAADRDVAAAVSSQFPRLMLTASVSTREDDAEDLFEDWASAFAANLTAPLIDAGRREAEVERTRAVEQRRLYEYGQTILTAFREVEDALIQERKQRERIGSLREQVRLAQQTYEQLRHQYLNGVADYLDVLTALSDAQALRRELLTARRELVEFRVALYRALAGGFVTQREAARSQSS